MEKLGKRIKRKITAAAAAAMMTAVIAVPGTGISIKAAPVDLEMLSDFGIYARNLHHFFTDSTAVVDNNHVLSTDNITSSNEEHLISLHPIKVTKAGNVYADRRRKGLVFWSSDKVWTIGITTVKYYSSGNYESLSGTFYYTLSNYDADNICSNTDITLDEAYINVI